MQEAAILPVAAVGPRSSQAGVWQHQGSLVDGRALRQRRSPLSSPLHRRAGEERDGALGDGDSRDTPQALGRQAQLGMETLTFLPCCCFFLLFFFFFILEPSR